MQPTLSEIVNSALSDADRGLKLASARDAAPTRSAADPLDFLHDELAVKASGEDMPHDEGEHGEHHGEHKREKKDDKEKKSSAQVIGDAEFAMKLAQALRVGANHLSQKLATGGSHDAPGPKIEAAEFINATTHSPKAHSKVTDRITGNTPHPAGLPNTAHDFTSPGDESGAPHNHPGKTAGWTKNKEASARILHAKVAQANMLREMGQHAAAEQLYNEVKEAGGKIAQDPSSPQPTLPGHSNSFVLDTSPGPSSHIPDNAGLINITKAQAKDPTTREMSQHISEPGKKDPAVAAHTLRTDGQKLSQLVVPPRQKVAAAPPAKPAPTPAPKAKVASVDPDVARAYIASAIKTASDPDATPQEREKAAAVVAKIRQRIGVDPDALLS